MAWRAPGGSAAEPYGPDDRPWRGRPAQGRAGRKRPGRRSRFRRFLKGLAITTGTLVIVIALAIGALWIATPSASEATQIAADQARQHGIAYPGPAVPATFSNALIATEDHRYFSEQGVDPVAVYRLVSSKITGNTSDQGGATLEQQLAKMLYTPEQSGAAAEVKQVVMAYKLDGAYSKIQILDLYAEVAYYGHGYYGLQAASCGYFGHPAADLTPLQGAMLAGVVNAPTYDDPIFHPAQGTARRAHVIERMVQVGDLTAAQGGHLVNSPLGVLNSPFGVVPRAAGCP